MKRVAIISAAYLALAVVTFGHSAAGRMPLEEQDFAACRLRAVKSDDIYCFDSRRETAAVNATIAGLLWPLYWSWEAWS